MADKVESIIDIDEIKTMSAMVATASGLRTVLKRSKSANDICRLIALGEITIPDVLDHVKVCLCDLIPGTRFRHEAKFSLVAVVLDDFKNENVLAFLWLYELASLRVAEMPMCCRVAKECLEFNGR